MGRLSAFVFSTLNGYLEAASGDISWHRHGKEENTYAMEGLRSGNILLFGRVTYQMMASYWPTTTAARNDPIVAVGMNAAEKIVFSRTLTSADWNNTKVVRGPLGDTVRELKRTSRKDMTLLGSGSILTQLADEDLVDEYQVMVDPVAIGSGTALFQGLKRTLELKLAATRSFRSGIVLISYERNVLP